VAPFAEEEVEEEAAKGCRQRVRETRAIQSLPLLSDLELVLDDLLFEEVILDEVALEEEEDRPSSRSPRSPVGGSSQRRDWEGKPGRNTNIGKQLESNRVLCDGHPQKRKGKKACDQPAKALREATQGNAISLDSDQGSSPE
jgi:hypothetical protein